MKISILGCGWLGLPLGAFLFDNGYYIKGSTRDKEKLSYMKESKIEPYLLVLDPELICDKKEEFFDTDVLIINIPPERRDDIVEYHTRQIRSLIDEIIGAGIKKVLFVSSTSVYPEENREVSEDEDPEPVKNSGAALKRVEQLLLNSDEFQTTVLRLAGLVGYDRNPRNFLKNRRVVHKINVPVNLVHRDDCINIIYEIIKKGVWGKIYNVCCDEHPKRTDFYQTEAEKADIEIPEIEEGAEAKYKIVSNEKLKRELNYSFIYPDPLNLD